MMRKHTGGFLALSTCCSSQVHMNEQNTVLLEASHSVVMDTGLSQSYCVKLKQWHF